MAEYPQPPERDWRRRLFGEPNSWRRMISIGIGAGAALAVVAALIAASLGGGGSSSLDNKAEPTPVASGGPVDGGGVVDEPTDVPVFETPTLAPTEQSTEEPVATELAPTEPVEEATPTEVPVEEEPTPVQTVVGA